MKLSRKEKINIVKAGVLSYGVSSTIAYFKHGGIQFQDQNGAWVIKIHKTMGVIDVFRMDGHLSKMEVFGSDGIFFAVGMFSAVAAAGLTKLYYWAKSEGKRATEEIK